MSGCVNHLLSFWLFLLVSGLWGIFTHFCPFFFLFEMGFCVMPFACLGLVLTRSNKKNWHIFPPIDRTPIKYHSNCTTASSKFVSHISKLSCTFLFAEDAFWSKHVSRATNGCWLPIKIGGVTVDACLFLTHSSSCLGFFYWDSLLVIGRALQGQVK